ncbi:NAD(P)-binding protein [Ophiobolus disseminans]|uniref:NAD(P)-binding protein n=1 Tax=Ophiobolus disseminans TaxID=1469910 RepID=A0A6A7A2E5_9PLEO|nr:NAD(P)-binding protein [Ophiobolus disseminans]
MANIAKEIVLVTGANSGIGFEIAHQFLARGSYHVLLSARSSQKGNAALQDLQSRKLPGSIEFLPLDVQSDDHIANAASHITKAHGKLDILVNNAAVAAISGGTERERLQQSFDINATGPYLLTKALIPLLRKASNPRIINISSGAGSLGRRLFPDSPMYKIQAVPYRASKAAFNMITSCLYVEYGLGIEQIDGEKREGEGEKKLMKVFAYDPGFTISNLGPHNKAEFGARTAGDTVKSIMEVLDGKRDEEAGKFIHNSGEYPW